MTIALTALQCYGLPGKAYATPGSRLLVDLDFSLKVGGHASIEFDDPTLYLEVQQDNGDTRLIIECIGPDDEPVDVSRASFLGMKIKYPDLTSADVNAAFLTDGTDGKITFTTGNLTLDQAGYYYVQALLEIGNKRKTTRWGTLRVLEDINLDDLA